MQQKFTIFLIEDDMDDQEIFSFVMEEINPNAERIYASDGSSALEKLNSDPSLCPAIIIIDINMPRMNGLQCLEEIKKVNRLKPTSVFMYSTSMEPKIVEACIKLGATGFIKKHSDIGSIKKEFEKIFSMLNYPA